MQEMTSEREIVTNVGCGDDEYPVCYKYSCWYILVEILYILDQRMSFVK